MPTHGAGFPSRKDVRVPEVSAAANYPDVNHFVSDALVENEEAELRELENGAHRLLFNDLQLQGGKGVSPLRGSTEKEGGVVAEGRLVMKSLALRKARSNWLEYSSSST